ncbi:GAF domain-containing protein [Streptomyces sp. CWNU-1]|uniref:GAF domain-containing protein n=1 Tax=Streptomyces albipurpureus TaxID=2897419 RepID=A0ABT0UYR4_9ACTN|nr:GAF domain-containing protein [Streptomyces sp. CWNU-1]MCM2393614.1 GAF domain-containing protein [Streptomyces sp. CWNU-1]
MLRLRRLRELGLQLAPSGTLDAFASRLATDADAPYAMVNFIGDRQFFAGLHNPPDGSDLPRVARTMTLDQGYCPSLMTRRKALVLTDVYASPRFAGNPVVDQIGIRSYAGAPLIDDQTGIAFGTICVVDITPRPEHTGQATLNLIKERRDELLEFFRQHSPLPHQQHQP